MYLCICKTTALTKCIRQTMSIMHPTGYGWLEQPLQYVTFHDVQNLNPTNGCGNLKPVYLWLKYLYSLHYSADQSNNKGILLQQY